MRKVKSFKKESKVTCLKRKEKKSWHCTNTTCCFFVIKSCGTCNECASFATFYRPSTYVFDLILFVVLDLTCMLLRVLKL